jgi:hypothetical protein
MNRTTRLRLHAVLFGSAALITAGFHVGLNSKHEIERAKLAHKAAGERSREIGESWKALPYSNAAQADVIEAFTAKIDWRALKLSDTQKTKLQSRLGQVLRYLIAPNVDEYCRFKTEGLHYRFKPSPVVMTNFLAGRLIPDTDLAVVRATWASLYDKPDHPRLAPLTGLCLDHVVAATTTTNSLAALLHGSVRKGFTVMTEVPNIGFEYPGLHDQPVGTDDASLFFQLSFFAQTKRGEKAGPAYLCLGWVPEDQEWALCRMISDSWSRCAVKKPWRLQMNRNCARKNQFAA